MPIEIRLPKLGESMIEGIIGRWLKQPGDRVDLYEPLLEIETDKISTELTSPHAGRLLEIVVAEGAIVPVGTLLALLTDPAEPPQTIEQPMPAERPPISPVVARLAAEHRIDLTQISGTGAGRRISKQDIERQVAPAAAALVPLTPMRRAIAEHLQQSVRSAPHVTTIFEIDVGVIAHHRTQMPQAERFSYTAYIAWAVVAALREHPHLNASYTTAGIVIHPQINLGIAVALDEGLVVPVIRNAGGLGLPAMASAINDYAARARTGQLTAGETSGGTFTITNHGIFGSLIATPIIHQPQVAILGIGAIEKRPVVISTTDGDAIAIRPRCYVSLSFDHRALDGAHADRFLAGIQHHLTAFRATPE
mgnify:CR=1 FL=1